MILLIRSKSGKRKSCSLNVESTQCPLRDKQMDKRCYLLFCYSALRKREILTPSPAMWDLEDSTQSEMTQTQWDTYCMSSQSSTQRVLNFIETESIMMAKL